MDGSGAIYVTDTRNFTIRKLTPMGTDWVVTTVAGQAGVSGSADGTNNDARFYYADGLAIDPEGNLFVADTSNHTIRSVTQAGTNWLVSTITGLAGMPGSNDGTNNDAHFKTPRGLAMDRNGTLYVSDHSNAIIRKVSLQLSNVVVTTIAGTPGITGSVDGTNGFALFYRPLGITADRSGNLYVADNHAIRRLTPEGTNWITRTIAGLAGTSGYLDGSNSTARFDTPCGVAADAATNLYVADFGNYVIRKITQLGTNWLVTTIAGLKGSVGRQDGTNSDARFWNPYGVAVGGDGVVFVSDAGNHTIRKI